ncbi:hypothetical protein ESCO_000143 [Escovopsis weberi]|uniref:MFS-type transporter n=1 Tax=Escovopsis weberi TaxID=150374 RepID=A0A0M8MV92_ESCWE|nr:hypothetical protein ESCO_000143 [Escovopsis weberi]
MSSIRRVLPFSASTTPVQALTYLLGISLFSISFLVFLNSSISFVVTDLIGQKHAVGDVVGTLGFADELVALLACPAWGLVSDRLGVRWVAVLGYAILACALGLLVQARNVYPQLLLARILFAVGGSATATMVTAILPTLTNDSEHEPAAAPETTTATTTTILSRSTTSRSPASGPRPVSSGGKPSVLAGYVGLFTGCGALLALSLFLPLPARFSEIDGVTPGQAVEYSFYVVGAAALVVAVLVAWGLRDIKSERGKGWRLLLGLKPKRSADASANDDDDDDDCDARDASAASKKVIPYLHLVKASVRLGFTDSRIALGYLGGFVARASTVAISLFIPLFVNTFFIRNGFCQGAPNDPSPDLKRECREAYVLSSVLTGVAQLMGLLCAPLFGHSASRLAPGRVNWPVVVAAVFGILGYLALPRLPSPEISNVDARGGSPLILLAVSLVGISQIGSIVCSLGSLGRGILAVDAGPAPSPAPPAAARRGLARSPGAAAPVESQPLISSRAHKDTSRVCLKGSISGVYSLCGGAAILILTKVGGLLFDKWSNGVPFYMMALFNAVLLVATLVVDSSHAWAA